MSIDDYSDIFDSAGKQNGIDPNLLRSIAQTESSGNPDAFNSDTGASGLMQIIPSTAKSLGVDDPKDPEQAINGAAKLMAENIRRYKSVPTAIMAYHGGTDPTNWGDKTHAYVEKVMGNYNNQNDTISGGSGDDAIDSLNQAIANKKSQETSTPISGSGDDAIDSLNQAIANKKENDVENIVDNAEKAGSSSKLMNIDIGKQVHKNIGNDQDQSSSPSNLNTPLADSVEHGLEITARAGAKGFGGIGQSLLNFPTNLTSAAKNTYEELTTPENRLALGGESAPFQEPLSSQDLQNSLSDAGLQKPVGKLENLYSDVISGATGGATGGVLGALGGALGSGGSSIVREKGGSPGQQLAADVVGNLLVPTSGNVLSSMSKEVNPLVVNLAKRAKDAYGIDIPNSQITASTPVKWLSSILPSIPGSGFGNEMAKANSQYTQAVSRTFGEDTPVLTRAVIKSAKERIGSMFNQSAESTPTVKIDTNKLDNIFQQAKESVEKPRLLLNHINFIKKQVDQDGNITGAQWQKIMQSKSTLNKLSKSRDNIDMADSAKEVGDSLRNDLTKSATPEAKKLLSTANQQYKNMKTVEDLANKAGATGDISPLLLLSQTTGTAKRFGDKGINELQELGDIGRQFFSKMPTSGTPEKMSMMKFLGPTGLYGIGKSLATGQVPDALTLAGGLAGTSAAANLAGRAINSQTYRNMLLNNKHDYIPGIIGGLATNPLVNQ